MRAGFTRDPCLLTKLNLYHIVSLGHEDCTHVSTVTATLDIGHQLDTAPLMVHNIVTTDMALLGVQSVLGVPQSEAPLSAVDME